MYFVESTPLLLCILDFFFYIRDVTITSRDAVGISILLYSGACLLGTKSFGAPSNYLFFKIGSQKNMLNKNLLPCCGQKSNLSLFLRMPQAKYCVFDHFVTLCLHKRDNIVWGIIDYNSIFTIFVQFGSHAPRAPSERRKSLLSRWFWPGADSENLGSGAMSSSNRSLLAGAAPPDCVSLSKKIRTRINVWDGHCGLVNKSTYSCS